MLMLKNLVFMIEEKPYIPTKKKNNDKNVLSIAHAMYNEKLKFTTPDVPFSKLVAGHYASKSMENKAIQSFVIYSRRKMNDVLWKTLDDNHDEEDTDIGVVYKGDTGEIKMGKSHIQDYLDESQHTITNTLVNHKGDFSAIYLALSSIKDLLMPDVIIFYNSKLYTFEGFLQSILNKNSDDDESFVTFRIRNVFVFQDIRFEV